MNLNNRIKRLSSLLTLLSKGYNLSTPSLSLRFGVSQKIIQMDFKEYLIPLFNDKKIYYDYTSKTYKSKNNFLTNTLYSEEELSVIAILKAKSKDKNLDTDLSEKTDSLFHKFDDILSNSFYQNSSVEKIDDFKLEIIKIKNAIETKNIIKCLYNNKTREVYPLKILNLEGYWYLIVFEISSEKVKTFHLNTIKDIEILNKTFEYSEDIVKSFDKAITAYYKVDKKTIVIQLFIEANIVRYFERKPISPTQRILKHYDDGSCDLELEVSDFMEVIPTIQRYIPFIKVIEPIELKNEIKNNLLEYIKSND